LGFSAAHGLAWVSGEAGGDAEDAVAVFGSFAGTLENVGLQMRKKLFDLLEKEG
jgi:hypothetical protein